MMSEAVLDGLTDIVDAVGVDEVHMLYEEAAPVVVGSPHELEGLLAEISRGTCELDHDGADLLLRNFDNPVTAVILRRACKNKIHPSSRCTFFVDDCQLDVRSGKRSRGATEEEGWLKVKESGSGSVNDSKHAPNDLKGLEGVARYSAGAGVGMFYLVAVPGHPRWAELEVRKGDDKWRRLKRLTIVNAFKQDGGPSSSADAASSSAPEDMHVVGSATIGGDLQVRGRITATAFESINADFAEVFLGEEGEEYCEGEVLLRVGRNVTRGPAFDNEPPPGSYHVKSCKPCLAGGPQLSSEEQPWAVTCALLGQVDVRVSGDAPVESKLVPSRLGDGRAVAMQPCDAGGAVAMHVIGIVLGPSELEGCVKAFVSPWGLSADTALGHVYERLHSLECSQTVSPEAAGELALEKVAALEALVERMNSLSTKGKAPASPRTPAPPSQPQPPQPPQREAMPTPPAPGRGGHIDAKSQLAAEAARRWKTPRGVVEYETHEVRTQTFQSTVTLVKLGLRFIGGETLGKKDAEQSASAIALVCLQELALDELQRDAKTLLAEEAAKRWKTPGSTGVVEYDTHLVTIDGQPEAHRSTVSLVRLGLSFTSAEIQEGGRKVDAEQSAAAIALACLRQLVLDNFQRTAKALLVEEAVKKWKTSHGVVEYDTHEVRTQRFQSTATLAQLGLRFIGGETLGKKDAEQSASAIALAYLRACRAMA